MITQILAIFVSLSIAHAKGSGGTSGGNPKPVEATHFNADKTRADKLKAAVRLLRQRIPENCFPKDYNEAVLAEMDRLIAADKIYYFPDTVMLGHDRYDGDYSQRVLANGNVQFYHVGAFTLKAKGQPLYFTRDSDSYSVEELAMTFVQDINDHVLQWNDEQALNSVGAMAMGSANCIVKMEYLADADDALHGYIRDPKTGTVITEFSYAPRFSREPEPKQFSDRLNMDPLCGSRQFEGNLAIKWAVKGNDWSNPVCTLKLDDNQMELLINRKRASICKENTHLRAIYSEADRVQ